MSKDRAIALWRLADMLRTNQDPELHRIADACDNKARKLAHNVGYKYEQLSKEIEKSSDISHIMD